MKPTGTVRRPMSKTVAVRKLVREWAGAAEPSGICDEIWNVRPLIPFALEKGICKSVDTQKRLTLLLLFVYSRFDHV